MKAPKHRKTTIKLKGRRSPGKWGRSKSRPPAYEYRVNLNDDQNVSG